MYISEGVLSAPVFMTGAVLAAGGVALGLKKMDYENIPRWLCFLTISSAISLEGKITLPLWRQDFWQVYSELEEALF